MVIGRFDSSSPFLNLQLLIVLQLGLQLCQVSGFNRNHFIYPLVSVFELTFLFYVCQDTCQQAECCYKEPSCSSLPECAEYATYCANLLAHLEGSNGSASGGTSIPVAPQNIDKTCSLSNVMSSTGYQQCQSACTGTAECCWKNDGAGSSCANNSNCQSWAACTILNKATVPPNSTPQSTSSPTNGPQVTLSTVFDACQNHNNNVGSGTCFINHSQSFS